MEYFSLCSNISQEEKKKFNLDFQEVVRKISELNMYNNSFENPYDRCAFMYKNAPCIISFIKDCVDKYLINCPLAKDVILKLKDRKNLNFISFTLGPALDYLSFCLALSNSFHISFMPSFQNLTVISNTAQWKHALQSLVESLKTGFLPFPISSLPNTYSINHNPNVLFNVKHKVLVGNADIVFMVKTLNFSKPNEFEERKVYFQNIIAAMKIKSYLFCIDTKPSVSAMFETLNQTPGKLIYAPVFNNFQIEEKFKFPESLKETYRCLPTVMAQGCFFVWEKAALNLTVPDLWPTNLSNLLQTSTLFNNNNNTDVFPSSVGTTQYSVIAENVEKTFSSDDQCKSIACISSKRDISDVIHNAWPDKLITLYSVFSSRKCDKDLENNANSNVKLSEPSTNLEMNAFMEQDIESILSDICETIDYDQNTLSKLNIAPILFKSFSDLSITKDKLASDESCSASPLSFDTFPEKIGDKNNIQDQRTEMVNDNGFGHKPKSVIPNPDVRCQSVLDDLPNITDNTFIKSRIASNKNVPNVAPLQSLSNLAEIDGDLSNIAHHSFMSSQNEFNNTHHPLIKSPVPRTKDLTSAIQHSSDRIEPIKRNGDLSTYAHQPIIDSPTEPNRDIFKFPFLTSEYVSANNSEGYFTKEISSLEIAELNSKSMQNQQVKSTSESLNSALVSDDSLTSLKTKSRTRKRKMKKLQNVTMQSSNMNNSKDLLNTPLYSSVLRASTLNTTTSSSLGLNEGFNTESVGLTLTGKGLINEPYNSGPIKNGFDFMDDDKTSSCSSINACRSSLKHQKNDKFEQTASVSQRLQKSVYSNTNVKNNDATNSSEIRLLTNRIKSLISEFDQITSLNQNDTTLRRNIAIAPCHSHLCKANSSCKNAVSNDLFNLSKTSSISNGPPNLSENAENENSKLEAEEFQSSSCCQPQLPSCCLSQSSCHQCCRCQKLRGCVCLLSPNCPLHGCFHCVNYAPSCDPACSRASQCKQACSRASLHEQASPTVPNIVIPLQNVTPDTLAQILAALKVTNLDS
ncbi:serine-rich adhesin for platelets isoform X1 [Parasteatoda tepidariorum]|uniref:serine-rich adhesin for platelets isoform X1 n=1 Tax=Parasteatoda tepidariorum TaxID=114398 RepID=UPI001C72245E|nr:uncharacterized protein LOC107453934 isoform X1 [Parasteatoda tepidariorum]